VDTGLALSMTTYAPTPPADEWLSEPELCQRLPPDVSIHHRAARVGDLRISDDLTEPTSNGLYFLWHESGDRV
jgi:hypothetical protein